MPCAGGLYDGRSPQFPPTGPPHDGQHGLPPSARAAITFVLLSSCWPACAMPRVRARRAPSPLFPNNTVRLSQCGLCIADFAHHLAYVHVLRTVKAFHSRFALDGRSRQVEWKPEGTGQWWFEERDEEHPSVEITSRSAGANNKHLVAVILMDKASRGHVHERATRPGHGIRDNLAPKVDHQGRAVHHQARGDASISTLGG